MTKRNEIRRLREEVGTLRLVLSRLYNAVDPINISFQTYDDTQPFIPGYLIHELTMAMLEAKEFVD